MLSKNENSEEFKVATHLSHTAKSSQSNEIDNSNKNNSTSSINDFNEIKEKGNTSFKQVIKKFSLKTFNKVQFINLQANS